MRYENEQADINFLDRLDVIAKLFQASPVQEVSYPAETYHYALAPFPLSWSVDPEDNDPRPETLRTIIALLSEVVGPEARNMIKLEYRKKGTDKPIFLGMDEAVPAKYEQTQNFALVSKNREGLQALIKGLVGGVANLRSDSINTVGERKRGESGFPYTPSGAAYRVLCAVATAYVIPVSREGSAVSSADANIVKLEVAGSRAPRETEAAQKERDRLFDELKELLPTPEKGETQELTLERLVDMALKNVGPWEELPAHTSRLVHNLTKSAKIKLPEEFKPYLPVIATFLIIVFSDLKPDARTVIGSSRVMYEPPSVEVVVNDPKIIDSPAFKEKAAELVEGFATGWRKRISKGKTTYRKEIEDKELLSVFFDCLGRSFGLKDQSEGNDFKFVDGIAKEVVLTDEAFRKVFEFLGIDSKILRSRGKS